MINFDPSTARLEAAPAAGGFDPSTAQLAPEPEKPGIIARAAGAAGSAGRGLLDTAKADVGKITEAVAPAAPAPVATPTPAPAPAPLPAAAPAPNFRPETAKPAPEPQQPGTGGIGSEFVQGFKAGVGGQNASMLGGALEAGGIIARNRAPGMAKAAIDAGQKLQDWGTEHTPTPQVGSITDVPGDGILDTAERAAKYAAFQAGSGIGTSAPSLVAGTAAGLATENPLVGFLAGAVGPSYLQNLGDVYTSAKSDPDISKALSSGHLTPEQIARTSALAAVPIAALDALSLENVLHNAFKPAKDELAKRILKGIATGAITEGSTEGLQDVVSQWAQSTLGQHKELKDRVVEVVDNALGGVFSGGLMGGVSGVRGHPNEPPPAPGGAAYVPREGEVIPGAPPGTARVAAPQPAGMPAVPGVPPGAPPAGPALTPPRTAPTRVDPAHIMDATQRGILIPVQQPGGMISRARAQQKTAEGTHQPDAPAPGMVRMYHGGSVEAGVDGPRWFSSNKNYAQQYAERVGAGKHLYYVDIPESHPSVAPDEFNPEQSIKNGFTVNTELPEEIARNAKPLSSVDESLTNVPAQPAAPAQEKGTVATASVHSPEAFTPTHELPDGTPVRATEEPHVYTDAAGTEIEDRNAKPFAAERIAAAAAQAATSPDNALAEPTDGQKAAGNYQKGHVNLHGLDIAIENPAGSKRTGVGENGKPWSVEMSAHYGYLKQTEGADGDQVDVYLTDHAGDANRPVYVFDQVSKDGTFDEHKAVLGAADQTEAEKLYDAHFSDGSGPKRRAAVTEMSIAEFKDWARGDTRAPVVNVATGEEHIPTRKTDSTISPTQTEKTDETNKPATKPFEHGPRQNRNQGQVFTFSQDIAHDIRRGARPVNDLHRKPTGWLMSDGDRGVVLIHPHEDSGLVFRFDEKSGTDHMRARARAQVYAIDNRIEGGTSAAEPAMEEPKSEAPRERWKSFTVSPAADPSWYVVREPSAGQSSAAQNLARFKIRDDGRLGKVDHFFESSQTREPVEKAIRRFVDSQKQGQAAPAKEQPKAAPKPAPESVKKDEPKAAPKPAPVVSANTIVTDDTAEAARKLLRSKLGQLNTGIDPEVLQAGITLAVYHIERGARTFAAYAKAMIGDLGDLVRPYLKSWYMAAKYDPRTTDELRAAMSPADEIDAIDASAILRAEEPTDGIQNGLPERDAGSQSARVQSTDAERPDGGAPAGEDAGGVPDAGRALGERAPRGKRGATRRARGERSGEDSAGHADRLPTRSNFRIEPGGLEEDRGWTQKARDNVRAIELLQEIESEGRAATPEEQKALSLYVGWGGMPGVFPVKEGDYGKGFEKVGARVRELLTDEEYDAASRSTQYAHYTSERIIRSMWDLAQRLGFRGGAIFEPGMGVGHFAGLIPADVDPGTMYQGLEMDPTSARIAKLLYPKFGVRLEDFTKAPLPENAFDLVIGNPPFADIPIKADPKYATHGFLLHDYFFAKSLDAVRPGGLLMFISSAGTMNKQDTKAREWMAKRADLIGAVRLPSNAFKQNAGTEVTTDILVFRKRRPGEAIRVNSSGRWLTQTNDAGEAVGSPVLEDAPEWVDVSEITLPNKDGVPTTGYSNQYFVEHPEMVLGEQGFFDKLYQGRYAVHATPGADLAAQLREALGRFPSQVMSDWTTTHSHDDLDFASGERKEGSYYLDKDGRLMQFTGGVGRAVERRGKGVEGGKSKDELDRIRALIPMRDALRAVYAADLGGQAEKATAARAALNKAYDKFVAEFGPINQAEFSYRRPNRVQAESARAEAREEARSAGLPFDEGSFDPTRMVKAGATLAAIGKARAEAREAALTAGEEWREGSFDPEDMPDIVIEKRPNIDPFIDDQESYRLRAIERYDEATGKATKGLVFSESTLARERKPTINSVGDALFHVLNVQGYPDIDAIAEAAGKSPTEVLSELGNSLFELPGKPGVYETGEDYLSGDVRAKLAEAEQAALRDERYERNVRALRDVQPVDLPPTQISTSLGMPWIPADVIEQFATEGLGLDSFSTNYEPKLAEWSVSGDSKSAAATSAWGTQRAPAPTILWHALNRVPIKIYDTWKDSDGRTHRELNTVDTEAALTKVAEVRQKFADWVYGDADRADRLAGIYNQKYNKIRAWEGDGSYLTTPGVSAAWSWRPHQLRVIARILRRGNTYMAHAVGAGKTSAMIGAGMEMRRLGLARKPMYVVPNHMLAQFTKEFYEQYPTAKIMVADERRFHTDRRKLFIAEVANQDLDAVIITHSSFGKIPMSPEFQDAIINEEIGEYRDLLDEIGDKQKPGEDSEVRVRRKRLENAIEKLEQRLSGNLKGGSKDQVFTFEELGVDYLFVDEAHLFRKLAFATRMSSVKGVSPDGAQKSMDLYAKIRYLRTKNPTYHVTLASGTPVTNTMAELYSVSRYMQEDELEDRGLRAFDAWAAAFGDTVTELEDDGAGGYKAQTRFAQFVNVPELSAMVRQIMDVVTSADLAKYVTRPKLKDGKRQLVLAEKSEALIEYQKALAQRMRAIERRKGPPKKGDDILLAVIGDGRHAAIDMRLVHPDLPIDPEHPSKLELLIDGVHRIFVETANQPFHKPVPDGYSKEPVAHGPATQMVFSNLGLSGTRGFNVHKHIVSELVRRGAPRDQIALIADFKSHVARQKLFNDMNDGKVRVLIGSTDKMATGVNAQRRLYAVHNLDPLWYPADDEQRNGRAIRQGNMNPEIEIHDYSTKGTYDAQMWNLMAKKARFIEGFFRGDPNIRTMDDLGESSQYEQAKAMTTNDPRLIELTQLRQDLEKAKRREEAFERETYAAKTRVRRARSTIENAEKTISRVEVYIKQRVDVTPENFSGQIGDTAYQSREEFAKALWNARKELVEAGQEVSRKKVGEFGGFPIVADVNKDTRKVTDEEGDYVKKGAVILTEDYYYANLMHIYDREHYEFLHGNGALAQVASMEEELLSFEGQINGARRAIDEAQREIKEFTPRTSQTFDGQGKIDEIAKQVRALEGALAAESAAAQAALQAQASAADPEPGEGKFAKSKKSHSAEGLSLSEATEYLERKIGARALGGLLQSGKLRIASSADSSVPADVKRAVSSGDRVFGFHDEKTGTTWLFHDNLNASGETGGETEDAYGILLHEIGVHYGMAEMLGPELFREAINRVALAARSKGDTEFNRAARAARAQIPGNTNPAHVDEETLAWLVTDRANHELPIVKRMLAKIKAFLFRMGFKGALDADTLVELARGAAARAGGRMLSSRDSMFARVTVTGTQAFKRWFAGSKVVDADGKPLVVYHGTYSDINEFDPDESGKNGFGVLIAGMEFTDDPYVASHYAGASEQYASLGYEAGNVMPVYLSIKNPFSVGKARHRGNYAVSHEFANVFLRYRNKDDIANDREYLRDYANGPHDKEYNIIKEAMEFVDAHGVPDGIVIRDANWDAFDSGANTQYIVFDPRQIKSATGNNGQFDPANPDIRYARRAPETPEFKAWFKNSKVVDADGKPLVVYHGTRARYFSVFAPGTAQGWGTGIYFTDNRQQAAEEFGDGGRVVEVYLSIQNPYRGEAIPAATLKKTAAWREAKDRYADPETAWEESGAFAGKVLRELGYDGIITRDSNNINGLEIVVFRPEQIKSTGNRGTFDPNNPDIRYARRAPETPWFKAWFKGSKAVDETGAPLRLYHGTFGNFSEFNPEMNPDERGIFLTPDPALASFFAYNPRVKGGNIMPVYAAIKNPMVVDFKGETFPYKTGIGHILEEARSKGHDGVILKNVVEGEVTDLSQDGAEHGPGTDQYIAFYPEQVKSAIGNRGTFDASNPDIRFARRNPVEWSTSMASGLYQNARTRLEPWLDEARYQIQDRFHYMNKLQQAAAAERGVTELPENEDVTLAELRYHGMAGAAIEDFQRDHVDPILKIISDNHLDVGKVDAFLHARHAEEANAQLQRINPTEEEVADRIQEALDAGDDALARRLENYKPFEGDNTALSGMSNAEAAQVMAKARQDGTYAALEDIGSRVDAITAADRQALVTAGLEKRGTVAAWERTYQHYVPLKREGFNGSMPRRGRGYDTRGRQKRRTGSSRAVEHVLANVVAQHEATLMRAEKAKVGRAFLEFARANPDPDLYEVSKMDRQPAFTADGLVTYRDALGNVQADNVFTVKQDGNDVRVTFNEQDPTAMKIAAALKNLGAEKAGAFVNLLTKFTRILSFVNTGANPEFIISNFWRDIQTAGYNLSGTEADRAKWAIIRDVGKAWKGIRAFQKGRGGQWAQYFDEFRKAGAKTGWLEAYDTVVDRETDLVRKVNEMGDGKLLKIKRGLRAVEQFIEDENSAVENAIRLSAFVHARNLGLSEAKAARLAKELTVNFNRRGNMGRTLNAMYLFFNASVQGSARVLQALATSPKVRRMAIGTIVAAALLDIWNRGIGDDDDKENPYDNEAMDSVKARNLVVMLSNGSYIKIPLPWGYNVLHVMGQAVGEMLTRPDAKATRSAARVFAAAFDAFNPIGGSASVLQLVSPTILDPVAQWAENKDWNGRPLRPTPNPFGVQPPQSQQFWNSTRPASKWLMQGLNSLTGGDEIRPGAVDFSPAALDLIIDTFTGGAGRFYSDVVQTPWKAITGQDLESYEVPLLRKVYGAPGMGQTMTEYYRNRDAVALTQAELKHYAGDSEKVDQIQADHGKDLKLVGLMNATEKQLKMLRKMKRGADDAERRQLIDRQMKAVMDRFNDARYRVYAHD
ncbi:MAG: hypothetical protein HY749_16375 [Gammaproteobacteria bacterium]|nr:hypothetical protein [Gammaproteobacteria bacterium]